MPGRQELVQFEQMNEWNEWSWFVLWCPCPPVSSATCPPSDKTIKTLSRFVAASFVSNATLSKSHLVYLVGRDLCGSFYRVRLIPSLVQFEWHRCGRPVFDVPGVTAPSFEAGGTKCRMQTWDNQRSEEIAEGHSQALTPPTAFTHHRESLSEERHRLNLREEKNLCCWSLILASQTPTHLMTDWEYSVSDRRLNCSWKNGLKK